jgi:hypothetical protein
VKRTQIASGDIKITVVWDVPPCISEEPSTVHADVSSSHLLMFLAPNTNGRLVNNELERMWKEGDVVYFEILYKHLSGGSEENHEQPQSG